jgi:N-acetylmuramoyl-L-alanine amidase
MTRMPAVRVECGYLSNARDARRLSDPAFRDAVAEGIAAAVVRFFAPDEA